MTPEVPPSWYARRSRLSTSNLLLLLRDSKKPL